MQIKRDVDSSLLDFGRADGLVDLQISALRAAANAVVITNKSGTVVWVNPAFERLTGYTLAEITGSDTRVLKSDQNPKALYEEMWRTILRGKVWRGELVNRRKDGSLYREEMTITPIQDYDGEVTHFIAIKLDISERKKIEAQLLAMNERLSLATAVAKMGVWELDLAKNVFTWDATVFEIYGLPPVVSLPYEKWSALVHPEDLPVVEAILQNAIVAKGQGSAEFRIQMADGTVRKVSVVGRVVLDEHGNIRRILGIAQDITEIRRAEGQLSLLSQAMKGTSEFIGMGDTNANITFANQAWLQALGYSEHEVVGRSFHFILSPNNPAKLLEEIDACTLAGGWRGECLQRRKDGTDLPVLLSTGQLKDREGRFAGVFGIARDITERVRAEERLRLWARVLDQSAEGIFICDPQERIVLVNRAFEEMTGFSADEAVGKTPRILQSGRQDKAFYTQMWKSVLETGSWRGEMWNRRKNGELYVEWLSVSAVYDQGDSLTHYIGIFSDITVRKRAEEGMVHLAHYDALTDLPNRVLLMDRLNQLTKSAPRRKSKVAVVFIDLDRFKEVNDSLGHDAGDLLLQTVAKRFSKAVREDDTVARIGGDEFVVVFQGIHDVNDAVLLAEKLLSCLVQPVQLNGYEVTVTASMGISLYPDDATNGQEMVRNADAAMYQAKGAGRNAYRFYTSDLNLRALEMLSIENALRRGLERQEFVLHYQPQVDIASGSVVGAEALIRWSHPELGLVVPGKFIPIAEERGLIVPIGNWVIDEAARQAAAWQNAGTPIRIAVNVSAVQFRHKDFVEQITKTVQKYGITPNQLELELTETIVMRDAETVVEILGKLHDIGFQLSIDDFGTGYSSLSFLRRFPIDKIKIDESFVNDENAKSIVTAVISLARSLNLNVIAEGVQTSAQLEMLREQSCNEAQGFLFSPALVPTEFEKLVFQGQPRKLGPANLGWKNQTNG